MFIFSFVIFNLQPFNNHPVPVKESCARKAEAISKLLNGAKPNKSKVNKLQQSCPVSSNLLFTFRRCCDVALYLELLLEKSFARNCLKFRFALRLRYSYQRKAHHFKTSITPSPLSVRARPAFHNACVSFFVYFMFIVTHLHFVSFKYHFIQFHSIPVHSSAQR